MRVTIVGAGAVGLNLAARLAGAGTRVGIVTRRPAVADVISRHGVQLEDPVSGETRLVSIDARDEPSSATGPFVLCVRRDETAAVAARLAGAAPGATVVSAQNDVDNESVLAEHFEEVIGLVVRQTCTLRDPRSVLATGQGRLVIGRHPTGSSAACSDLAAAFEAAGFDVGRSPAIRRDKWLKLVQNTTSAVNALVVRPDHTSAAFVALKIGLIEEARDALDAAGIEAESCDGRDRSMDEEIAHLRASLSAGTSGRDLPLYNACWTALRDPSRPLEADAYHARIAALGAAHGVPTPTHVVMRDAVTEAYTQGRGPECLTADALRSRARAQS